MEPHQRQFLQTQGPSGPAVTPAAAVANATQNTLLTQFNQLLANLRAAGLLANS